MSSRHSEEEFVDVPVMVRGQSSDWQMPRSEGIIRGAVGSLPCSVLTEATSRHEVLNFHQAAGQAWRQTCFLSIPRSSVVCSLLTFSRGASRKHSEDGETGAPHSSAGNPCLLGDGSDWEREFIH